MTKVGREVSILQFRRSAINMFQETYFLLLLSTCLQVEGMNNSSSLNTFSESLNALLDLMSLTESTCGKLDFCTVKNEKGVEPFMAGCCPPCSCDQSCMVSQTCCPDFKLSRIVNGTVFQNLTDLVFAIQNETHAQEIDTELAYGEVYEEAIADNASTECVHSRLFGVNNRRPKSNMYRMVSKCSNMSASVEMKRKCESPEISPENGHISDFVPVQSPTNGAVYRNKYCAQCNGESVEKFTEWDIYVASQSIRSDIFREHFPSMAEFFKYLFGQSQKWGKIDIFFEPNESSDGHETKKCNKFEAVSCQKDNDTNQDEADACQKYTFPMHTNVDGRYKAFKNLACLSCTGLSLSGPGNPCSAFVTWSMSILPFLGRIQRDYIPQKESLGRNTSTNIAVKFSLACEIGYVYDSSVGSCRKMHCPCGMVVHNLTCVPIFQDVYNKMYEAYLDIAPPEELVISRYTELDQALFDYLEDAFNTSEKFTAQHIGLWRSKGQKPNPKRYFAYVVFAGPNQHSIFQNAIAMVDEHFRGTKTVKYRQVNFKVYMSVTSDIQMSFGQASHIVNDYKYEIVKATSDIFHPDSVTKAYNNIRLLECNFCHMVELLPEEKQFRGLALRIKTTDTITMDFSHSISNISRVFVCVEKVLGNIDARSVSGNGRLDRGHNAGDDDDKYDDGGSVAEDNQQSLSIGMSAALGSLAFVIFILVVIKKYLKQRSQSE